MQEVYWSHWQDQDHAITEDVNTSIRVPEAGHVDTVSRYILVERTHHWRALEDCSENTGDCVADYNEQGGVDGWPKPA